MAEATEASRRGGAPLSTGTDWLPRMPAGGKGGAEVCGEARATAMCTPETTERVDGVAPRFS